MDSAGSSAEGFLEILETGLSTLVVDEGRSHYRSLGIPIGGAFDRFSYALGNALIGNNSLAAALEITLVGPTLRANRPLAGVVFGAPFRVTQDDRLIEPGTTFNLAEGQCLKIGACPAGVRGYLCVAGGFLTASRLGSRSGFRPVEKGETLPFTPSSCSPRRIEAPAVWDDQPRLIRVVDGPQADWFTMADLESREFLITPSINRMGLRLQSTPLAFAPQEMASEAVTPGSIQITRDGQAIILGIDGQTIGGYPKIAQVISADWDKLAQLRPGEDIRFTRVDPSRAKELFMARQETLSHWTLRLKLAKYFPAEPDLPSAFGLGIPDPS